MNSLLNIPKDYVAHTPWVWLLVISIFSSLGLAIVFNEPLLAGIPFLFLLLYASITDFRLVFYLLLLCLPLSTEYNFPNGLGTDLPTEPLMVGLTGVFLLYALRSPDRISGSMFTHPISLSIGLHIAWLTFATFFSENLVVSIKFLLAKIWYIVPFFMLFLHLFRDEAFLKRVFWILFFPMLMTVIYVLYRHSLWDFAFDKVNSVTDPFYRNHVNYACIQAIFLPYIFYFWLKSRRWSIQFFVLSLGILVFLLGIWFSYTRAAYVVLVIPVITYFILRFKLIKASVGVGMITLALGSVYFLSNNTYLEYAPEYEKTITHKDFGNLLSATAKGEDISTMERFYRWVAGVYMVKAKPVTGFGPGNFYNYYRSYTVTSFQTYVSDNPEKSGIHNYFLMTAVDQGIPGLIVFLLLCSVALFSGQDAYTLSRGTPYQDWILLSVSTILVILALLFINDLLEVDKVGPFFFMALALIVKVENLLNK